MRGGYGIIFLQSNCVYLYFKYVIHCYFSGFISSHDYIRLRTTTKDTKRPQKVAKKTQTYLDKVRQKYVIETPSTTTTSSTTTSIKFDEANYPENIDHPTSHRRPSNDESDAYPEIPKSGKPNGERSNIRGVQLVTPVYGEFTPSSSDSNERLNDPRYFIFASFIES